MEFDPDALPIPALGLRCPRCEYLLDGLPRRRCPECGREFTMDELVPPGEWPLVSLAGRPVRLTDRMAALLRQAGVPYIAAEFDIASYVGAPHALPSNRWFRVSRWDYLYTLFLLQHPDLAPPAAPPSGERWRCPQCGRSCPPNFELCWNCEAARPVSP